MSRPRVHVKKKRKKRGLKKDGTPSYDLCPTCLSWNCDPMYGSPKFHEKVNARKRAGLCPACGHNPCTCKSTL